MTISDWNKKPFTCKGFSQPFHPMSYNYIDYMDVLGTICFICTTINTYGLLSFLEVAMLNFLLGLKKWWTFFIILESIFPFEIQEKFNFYKSKTST